MRDLEQVLREEHGFTDLALNDGVRFPSSGGIISADGRVLVGNRYVSTRPFDYVPFVIYLDRPLVVTSDLPGDFNNNDVLDAEDIHLLAIEQRSDRKVDAFDLTGDGDVSIQDFIRWVHHLKNTYFGDANLDGHFNPADLVAVLTAGQYEDTVAMNSTWATGDWNADGEFNRLDLVVALQDGGYGKGPRIGVAAVPEPTTGLLAIVALLGLFCARRLM